MNSFLKESKDVLSSTKRGVTVVVGNESCDLDSMTSAILYAWFRRHQSPQTAVTKAYIPLLNIPREDLPLRPEFKALFKHCNIDEVHLATRTDLSQAQGLSVEQTQWILVDHNKLEGELGSIYSQRVVGCIDHHEEENAVPKGPASEPRIVERCGSCTSLVLRELAMHLSEDSEKLVDAPPYTTDALKLGLASILIDTNNLQDKNKVTNLDYSIVTAVDKILISREPAWSKNEFFNELSTAKRNLEGLTVQDILRKDYKQWTEGNVKLGMSSVVKDLGYLFAVNDGEHKGTSNIGGWAEASSRFMHDRGLDIWAVMTTFSETRNNNDSDLFRRQLMIHWAEARSAEIVKSFEQKFGTDLKLSAPDIELSVASQGPNWIIWQQGNTAASRKQVGPKLRTVMKQESKI